MGVFTTFVKLGGLKIENFMQIPELRVESTERSLIRGLCQSGMSALIGFLHLSLGFRIRVIRLPSRERRLTRKPRTVVSRPMLRVSRATLAPFAVRLHDMG